MNATRSSEWGAVLSALGLDGSSLDSTQVALKAHRDLGVPGAGLTLYVADGDGTSLVQSIAVHTDREPLLTAVAIPLAPVPLPAYAPIARCLESDVTVRSGGSRGIRVLHRRLRVGPILLGVLAVQVPSGGTLVPGRIAQVARQAAAALMLCRTAEARRSNRRAMSTVQEILATYGSGQSLDYTFVMSAIASVVQSNLGADRCLLVECEDGASEPVRVFSAGSRHLWDASQAGPVGGARCGLVSRLTAAEQTRLMDGLAMSRQVAREGRATLLLVLDNLLSQERLDHVASEADWRLITQSVAAFWRLWHRLEQVRTIADRDELTGLWNRRGGSRLLEDWAARSHALGTPLTVLFFDLDGFKAVNDRYGHLVGDEVLQAVGHWLQEHIRTQDIAYRYGGDEFVVVMPGLSAELRPQVVDHLMDGLRHLRPGLHGPSVRVSLGAAVLPEHGVDSESLLRLADASLYRAKRAGGNQWRLAMGRREAVAAQ